MALRDDWKKTGSSLGHAFQNLGKSIIRSVRVGVDKADDWAEGDEKKEAGGNEQAEQKPPVADAEVAEDK